VVWDLRADLVPPLLLLLVMENLLGMDVIVMNAEYIRIRKFLILAMIHRSNPEIRSGQSY
jgi:hypothetical protein